MKGLRPSCRFCPTPLGFAEELRAAPVASRKTARSTAVPAALPMSTKSARRPAQAHCFSAAVNFCTSGERHPQSNSVSCCVAMQQCCNGCGAGSLQQQQVTGCSPLPRGDCISTACLCHTSYSSVFRLIPHSIALYTCVSQRASQIP